MGGAATALAPAAKPTEIGAGLVPSSPEDYSGDFCHPSGGSRGSISFWLRSQARRGARPKEASPGAVKRDLLVRAHMDGELTNAAVFSARDAAGSCIATICPAHNPIYGTAGRPVRKLCVPRRCRLTGKDAGRSFCSIVSRSHSTVDVGQSASAEAGRPARCATADAVGATLGRGPMRLVAARLSGTVLW